MSILTAVNKSDCFNQKIQRQILFDIADLLKELNPNNYPAFAFAWLELISHKQFMPHFIKRQTQPMGDGSNNPSSDKAARVDDEKEDEDDGKRNGIKLNQKHAAQSMHPGGSQ